jgi:acetylglutamate kinase
MRPIVLKFGGELLEDPGYLATVVAAVQSIAAGGPVAAACGPIVIVHGGGKEIDAALRAAGLAKRQVDGLRITDWATLDVVISVLAGTINTRLVAALNAAGVAAVGLTGADANCGLCAPAPPHRTVNGDLVDLDRVGVPSDDADMRLLQRLIAEQFVPVLACIGLGRDGRLLNVNADTLAGFVAARLAAKRLVIAGTTPGVLDAGGNPLAALDPPAISAMVSNGTATAGMIAKLRACERAVAGGVDEVVIVDGRNRDALIAAATSAPGTSDVLTHATRLSRAGTLA